MMTTQREALSRREGSGEDRALTAVMGACCEGRPEAFEELYRRVAPHVFGQLLSWTDDRQRAAALLQRTFQSLHACRSLYVEGADPLPWLLELARNELALASHHPSSETRRAFWARLRAAFGSTASLVSKKTTALP